jgi:predicted transcriptional regulator
MSPAAVRAALHRLLDELPDEELPAAGRFLEFLGSVARQAQEDEVESERVGPGQLARESIERWEQYQASGEYLDDGEVLAWVKSWGTSHELPPPTPRRRPPR